MKPRVTPKKKKKIRLGDIAFFFNKCWKDHLWQSPPSFPQKVTGPHLTLNWVRVSGREAPESAVSVKPEPLLLMLGGEWTEGRWSRWVMLRSQEPGNLSLSWGWWMINDQRWGSGGDLIHDFWVVSNTEDQWDNTGQPCKIYGTKEKKVPFLSEQILLILGSVCHLFSKPSTYHNHLLWKALL
jgi:hypothetical protein